MVSGVSKERTQLKLMLEYLRDGDIVVVTELERLGRNNKELTEVMNHIQDRGATLEVLNLPSLRGIEDENLRRTLKNREKNIFLFIVLPIYIYFHTTSFIDILFLWNSYFNSLFRYVFSYLIGKY